MGVTDKAVPGPLLFARYAFGPNRLGYCGPADAGELFELTVDGKRDADMRALAQRFEGAWPYLELIARATDRPDPLDPEVVEAYWLGSDLLDRVRPLAFGESIERRFKSRVHHPEWQWLRAKPGVGAKPIHAFHVLDVFPRMGLLRSDRVDDVLNVIESCRIRWGRVLSVNGDWLATNVVPLQLTEGRLELGRPRVELIQAWQGGAGFMHDIAPGDAISIHWTWACERLDGRRLGNLVTWTNRQLALTNQTI
jgi:hypothetical protein